MFGLLLTSVKVFFWGVEGCEHMRACASVMWVLKIISYMWYPQNISLLVNFTVEIFILYR